MSDLWLQACCESGNSHLLLEQMSAHSVLDEDVGRVGTDPVRSSCKRTTDASDLNSWHIESRRRAHRKPW